MPALHVHISYTTPDTPNFPGNTPEVFATAVHVMQGDVAIASDSRIPPVTPDAFVFDVPAGDYTVEAWIAAPDWSPIGPKMVRPVTVHPDVIRPVMATVTF